MNIKRFVQSFVDAARGVSYTFKHEQNFRVQTMVALLVIVFIIFLPLSKYEIIIVFLMITLVLLLELINTAVEKMLDLLKPRMSFHVQTVKHVMAATVFLASIAACVIGGFILFPHIIELFWHK